VRRRQKLNDLTTPIIPQAHTAQHIHSRHAIVTIRNNKVEIAIYMATKLEFDALPGKAVCVDIPELNGKHFFYKQISKTITAYYDQFIYGKEQ